MHSPLNLSSNEYNVDLIQPDFKYSFILNDIYNNYFDMYIQANEGVNENDSTYFSYNESDVINQISENFQSHLADDLFFVTNNFNEYGDIRFYLLQKIMWEI